MFHGVVDPDLHCFVGVAVGAVGAGAGAGGGAVGILQHCRSSRHCRHQSLPDLLKDC